ncbi:alpha/beta hydrolase [Aureisphaera galaxeae]|uniref:alpha/beta fold hydrolase n=1 Tax=Aureisphaera galaxeae TaxID=1538023 RepID=UPI002350FEF3|nr:alpha/beta hydrolase [Aureisphaera galaxeae]MDC8004155.1 alpha/beta hydrolase [Aureisphaera galaxeae]
MKSVRLLSILFFSLFLLTLQVQAQQLSPPPGQKVDIGGYALHLNVMGTGSKTIIIEAGAGAFSLQWLEFQKTLSKHFTVITYDRAGYGWSDPSPYSRTAKVIAEELHTALTKLEKKGPYILMGHSYGGLVIKTFLNNYPKDVEALILADAATEFQFQKLPPMVSMIVEAGINRFKESGTMARKGMLQPEMIPIDSTLTAKYWKDYQKISSTPAFYDAMVNEMTLMDFSYSQSKVKSPTNVPLLVITAGNSFEAFRSIPGMPVEESNVIWERLQKEQLKLSSKSEQTIIPEATHDMVLSTPKELLNAVVSFVNTLN